MCFSLAWIMNLLIWAVVIGAVYAIIKLLLPLAFAQIGIAGDLLLRILTIIVWAAVLIFIIVVAFELLGCLVGMPSAHLLR
jgi:hypothetical protein